MAGEEGLEKEVFDFVNERLKDKKGCLGLYPRTQVPVVALWLVPTILSWHYKEMCHYIEGKLPKKRREYAKNGIEIPDSVGFNDCLKAIREALLEDKRS